ncbi:MAG: zinc-dependent metalloprotease [Taibaiella sp.]|nr:zinc-dependent metalloprotease [Taibaiella sp.]
MTKTLRRTLCCLFITASIIIATSFAVAAQQECYSDSPAVTTFSIIGPNAVCGLGSADWMAHFYKPQSFDLEDYSTIAKTSKKEIKIKVIVVTNTYYSWPNFTIADTATLRNIFETWPNNTTQKSLSSLKPTNKPQSNICNDCYISDSRFRIRLTGIEFKNTYEAFTEDTAGIANKTGDAAYHFATFGSQEDSILNVFVVNYGFQQPVANTSQGGYAVGGGNNFNLITNPVLGIIAYNYKINDYPAAATQFVHELGHLFALRHISNHECNDITDRLVDIYPPGVCEFPDNVLPYGFDPANLSNTHTYNYMEVVPGGYFSPIQLSRMHRSAHLGDMSSYVYPIDPTSVAPYQVHTDQVWDFGIRMYKDIIVKANNTLTIKCVVEMPPLGRITVEKGAKLILDGGTITSYHEKVGWHGIQLYGDKNMPPYAYNQGSFEMKNNALIEYAYDGVQDFTDGTGFGGGIIQVSNSTFKDCRRAIELNDYPGYPRGSSCTISNMNFLTTNPLAATNAGLLLQDFPTVSAFNERDVLISNCTFKNTIPTTTPFFDVGQRNRAIYSEDAGFRIEGCSFEGYKEAINIGNYSNHPFRSVKVMNCSFDKVATGILFADNFSYAQGNTFDHPLNYVYSNGTMAYLYEGQAIYADNAGGLTLTTNTVLNSGNNPNTRGITVNRSLATGARVIDNSISSARLGIITQNDNPALDLLCNHFGGGDYNLLLNPQSPGSLLKDQGNGCGPLQYRAGNTFSNGTLKHIACYLNNPNWMYYYWLPEADQDPANTNGTFIKTGCSGVGTEDPNSLCNLPGNVESLIEQMDDDAFHNWALQIAPGPLTSQQLAEFAGIVQHFNASNNLGGLLAFLAAIDHVAAQKLLVPLYLEQGDYGAMDQVINNLAVSDAEQADMQAYYSLLRNLAEEGRSIYELDAAELTTVREIAAGAFDISARARSLLAFAYGEEWHHYQEQLPPMLSSGKAAVNVSPAAGSILYDAVPNPAQAGSRIAVSLSEADAINSSLLIRDMMGKVLQEHKLAAGWQSVAISVHKLPAGVYTYSLLGNGKVLQVKRLVVLK